MKNSPRPKREHSPRSLTGRPTGVPAAAFEPAPPARNPKLDPPAALKEPRAVELARRISHIHDRQAESAKEAGECRARLETLDAERKTLYEENVAAADELGRLVNPEAWLQRKG